MSVYTNNMYHYYVLDRRYHFMCDERAFDAAHLRQPVRAILYLTQHRTFAHLMAQEVYELRSHDSGTIAGKGTPVTRCFLKECFLFD